MQSSSESIQVGSIEAQRIRIVGRVRQNKLDNIELEFRQRLAAIDEVCTPCREDKAQLVCWRQSAYCDVNDYCAIMEQSGVVMGEPELQAVADLRMASVEVNVLCILINENFCSDCVR